MILQAQYESVRYRMRANNGVEMAINEERIPESMLVRQMTCVRGDDRAFRRDCSWAEVEDEVCVQRAVTNQQTCETRFKP